MKHIPINTARTIGNGAGARKVVIIAVDDEDYCITTWGVTTQECRALAKWAESKKAEAVVTQIADAKPSSGIIHTALDPQLISELD